MKSTALLRRLPAAALALGMLLSAAVTESSRAQTFDLTQTQPAADIWEYPFAGTPGTNKIAATFGATGNADFDNRDAQVYFRFDTGGTVPIGLAPSMYQVVSLKITLSVNSGGFKVYDGSYDPVNTFAPDGTPINGDDPGRPMELFGVGYRNGVTSTSVSESTPFSTLPQPQPRSRSLYPTDFVASGSLNGGVSVSRDVSNSVTDQFNTTPFGIGQVAAQDLNNGFLKEDAEVVFNLSMLNTDLLRYLQLSLAEGRIGLIATSLEQASQGGPVVYPDYYTRENTLGAPPKLELVVQVIPEPATAALLLAGAWLISGLSRRRSPHKSS